MNKLSAHLTSLCIIAGIMLTAFVISYFFSISFYDCLVLYLLIAYGQEQAEKYLK